ncbi:hypothetical protein SDC9_122507 [bioreactor metagenome]|uniref:Uncharacterized protein n=1 Tax=bioreactor metagenome TaxID=1076179 RepID=A0A645CF17_9ZZZZ
MDLPTLGNPNNPTSAIILSSNIIHFSSPSVPDLAKFGACLTAFAKLWFPFPPLPPLATTALSPSSFKSAIILLVASSLIIVPAGTFKTKSSPFFPACLFLLPSPPGVATYFLWYLKSISVLKSLSTSNITLAPLPPSPPSGPPAGTYFSLLNDTAPFPPFPALTNILALSINKSGTSY